MSLIAIIFQELRSILKNPAILLTVFGGVIFYTFLYPLPYIKQLPKEQHVVVVNLDNSQLSRQLERMVDATPEVKLIHRASSLEEARNLFLKEKLAGILVIPEHFYRDLLLGRQPTLSYAGDASYFLVYGTVVQGMARAGGIIAAQIKIQRLLIGGEPLALAKQQHSAIHLDRRYVFNPTSGYVNYVIPAVFILILHQTLLIGAGIAGATQNEKDAAGETGYWQQASAGKLILARAVVFSTIYWLLSIYYFGFSFDLYHIPHKANLLELNLLLMPFLLATSFLGSILGILIPRRELVTFVVLLSSLLLVFGSGFIWPVEMIPRLLTAVLQPIPVIPGIQSFVSLNQMRADFSALLPQIKQLWGLTLIYGLLAVILLWSKIRGRKKYTTR